MVQYNELPVYKATCDLLLVIFQFTREFGGVFTVIKVENLREETIELLTLIYLTNTRHPKTCALQMARDQIEVIDLLIQELKDMKKVNCSKFERINHAIENVLMQLMQIKG